MVLDLPSSLPPDPSTRPALQLQPPLPPRHPWYPTVPAPAGSLLPKDPAPRLIAPGVLIIAHDAPPSLDPECSPNLPREISPQISPCYPPSLWFLRSSGFIQNLPSSLPPMALLPRHLLAHGRVLTSAFITSWHLCIYLHLFLALWSISPPSNINACSARAKTCLPHCWLPMGEGWWKDL